MGVFQYKLEAIPKRFALENASDLKKAVDEKFAWENHNNPSKEFITSISDLFSKDSSWGEVKEYHSTGQLPSKIQIYMSDDKLESILFKYAPCNDPLDLLAEFVFAVKKERCLLFSLESGKLLRPELSKVIEDLSHSRSMNFVNHPHQTLKEAAMEFKQNQILKLIESCGFEAACFGSQGFQLGDANTMNEMQIGYRTDVSGKETVGNQPGDWHKSWLVIARDLVLQDPFFVDMDDPDFRVFTAIHGVGEWNPEPVARSLSAFLKTLSYLRENSLQEDIQMQPDRKTITQKRKILAIENELKSLSGVDDYWVAFINQHKEWINEFR